MLKHIPFLSHTSLMVTAAQLRTPVVHTQVDFIFHLSNYVVYVTTLIVGQTIQGVSEIHGTTLEAYSVHRNDKKCMCTHECLDASFFSYGPFG
jgi:hypothetical protein